MDPYKKAALSDGSHIKLLAATQDEYQAFIRLSPTLVLGHAVLLGKHYLHLYKADGDVYYFHGSVYFNERPDGSVIWNMSLACNVSEARQLEAKNLAAKSSEFANQVPGVGIFLQLLSATALPEPTSIGKRSDSKKRRPNTGTTRTTRR